MSDFIDLAYLDIPFHTSYDFIVRSTAGREVLPSGVEISPIPFAAFDISMFSNRLGSYEGCNVHVRIGKGVKAHAGDTAEALQR